MSDYIDRQAAIDALGDIHPLDYNAQAYKARIEKLPSADVEPVRHGRWENTRPDAPMFGFYYCSECGRKRTSPQDHYCPNCGAKMEGEEDDGKGND